MTAKKFKNIGIDFDDVILNFTDSFVTHLNQKYNKNIDKKDLKTFNYVEQYYGLNDEEAYKHFIDFITHEMHLSLPPIEGSVEVISKLFEKSNLFIITARSDALKDPTHTWLNKHLPEMFKSINFTTYSKENKTCKKSEKCRELSIDIFIDDSLDNAHDVSSIGIPVLLFNTPWNQTEDLPPLVTRVHSWEDILKELY